MIEGLSIKAGDDINTDIIIPVRYCNETDPLKLGKHCFEGLKEIYNKISNQKILIAGNNFGCGSSRETAPLAILGCGISCIVAKSYARIFYRNCIYTGLYPIICEKASCECKDNDRLKINLETGTIINQTTKCKYTFNLQIKGTPKLILKSGGFINYMKNTYSGGRYDKKTIPLHQEVK
jgi:3-isopropylmalate/(R)-2-methylmalate dehydratase small subunit